MTDLLQSARMFEASSKTQSACAYLQELAEGKEPGDKREETLKWVGDLLPKIDWDYSGKLGGQIADSMNFEATSARPAFYASLVKLSDEFKKAGMDEKKKVDDFLGAVYELLSSGGIDKKSRKKLDREKLRLAAKLLFELAQAILRQYGSRMPRRPELYGYFY